ncbi:PAS domain-containing protein [Halomonas sediminis]
MQEPAIPEDEPARQQALDETGLIDSKTEERFDRLTRMALRHFSLPIALLTLVDAERQWFKSCQGLNVLETSRNISFCGHTILFDEPLLVENALEDERFADNPLVQGEPNIRFYAGIPLHAASGHRIGTFCIIDRQPRTFSEKDVEALRDFAGAIEDMMLADVLERQARSSIQHALVDNERRARLVIEGTRVGTWQWNVQTGETVFNERWAEITGYTLSELAPISIETWLSLAHPDDLAHSETLLKEHFSGETSEYDCKARMRHRDGHWVWVHDRGRLFEWTPDGQPLLMFGTHADITAEVEAEQALVASRNEYASLVANMPGITYRCLPNECWTMLYMSDQAERVTGYPAAHLIDNVQLSYAELVHPDDTARLDTVIRNAMRLGEEWHLEYRIQHRDGRWRWVEERGRSHVEENEQGAVLEGFIIDITRQYEAREQLAHNHEALSLLNQIAFNIEGDLDERINRALLLGRDYLGMAVAIVSQIEADDYIVRWCDTTQDFALAQGQRFSLGQTYCQLTLDHVGELAIKHMNRSPFHGHPCYQAFALESYVGIEIEVEEKCFGTLSFSSAQPREENFSDSELLFVRLLARWLSDTLRHYFSNERLNKLLAQVPGMIYQFRRFPGGRVCFPFSSPGIQMIHGISPESAAADAGSAFERIHPDDLHSVAESIEHSAETLQTWAAQYRVQNSNDAGYRWVSGQARPERLTDGSVLWHGYIQDINERKQVELALECSEARLRSLFEFAPIGIALNDLETGQFIELNDALVAPSGYSREEFSRLSYWDITPQEYTAEEEDILKSLEILGRYGPFEKEYIRKDGTRYPVRLQGILSYDPDGRRVGWSLIEDISERKKLDQMKDQFIATVSHELRTPLTSISGSLGLLLGGAGGVLSDKAERLLEIAQRNSQRLAILINDLLDMEKLVAGKMPMHLEVQALMPIIDEALEANADYGSQYGVILQPPDQRPDVAVKVDRQRLVQALSNLLSNAIKFSPDHGVVDVQVSIDAHQALINVRDHGPGVDALFRDKLFKRFSQADSGDKRKLPGTGLGLAITREIMEQMNGAVDYQEADGGGSCFWIRLPCRENV